MDKNTRICIIGGGPAGLSAGMYLEQKGYENYTILERNDHVGGKCHSPHITPSKTTPSFLPNFFCKIGCR